MRAGGSNPFPSKPLSSHLLIQRSGLWVNRAPESFASRFGSHRVPARRRFRPDANGRRVFTEHTTDVSRSFGSYRTPSRP